MMKKIIILSGALISQTCFAAIGNSTYESSHNIAIEKEILKNCGDMNNLNLISFEKVEVRIDQGVRDFYFTSKIKANQEIDQGIVDNYLITVKSEYSDAYDFENARWGSYLVSSVDCQLE